MAGIQPLMTAHAVLRLTGERADKKRAHWEAIAVAACEQCGRNRVPRVHPVRSFANWLEQESASAQRLVLSLGDGTRGIAQAAASSANEPVLVLSGPGGGLSRDEDEQARKAGFAPVTLGARVLRAETAALAALVLLAGQGDADA